MSRRVTKVEIQSLRTPTEVIGIPEALEPAVRALERIYVPTGRALELELAFEAAQDAGAITAEPSGPPIAQPAITKLGRIVQPKIKRGKVVMLAPRELAERSSDELLSEATIEPATATLGIHDVDQIDMKRLIPLAKHAAQSDLDLVIQVGEADD